MIRNIVILEEERLSAKRLIRLLNLIRPQIVIDAIFINIADVHMWFATHVHPDLLIMNYRLSERMSFEIFNKFKVESAFLFTTVYDELILRLLSDNQVDYLLKPIDVDELQTVLEKLDSSSVPLMSVVNKIKLFYSP